MRRWWLCLHLKIIVMAGHVIMKNRAQGHGSHLCLLLGSPGRSSNANLSHFESIIGPYSLYVKYGDLKIIKQLKTSKHFFFFLILAYFDPHLPINCQTIWVSDSLEKASERTWSRSFLFWPLGAAGFAAVTNSRRLSLLKQNCVSFYTSSSSSIHPSRTPCMFGW